jgi:predicted  nucleic acid-binding Zn-ribbon protein
MAEENNNIEQKISLTYDTNAQETAKEVGTLNTAIDNTTQSQNENTVATDKSTQNLKTFKTQLREANQELLKVSQTFGETSKEAVQAAKKVADLKDQMQFSKDLVDNFNPDQKFKALGAATQIATTATSGLVSGMALFGDQSEDTQKALLKVQAAMAFSDAVSGLSNLGDQRLQLNCLE